MLRQSNFDVTYKRLFQVRRGYIFNVLSHRCNSRCKFLEYYDRETFRKLLVYFVSVYKLVFPSLSVRKKKGSEIKFPSFFQNARATFSRKLQTYDYEKSFSPFLDLVEHHDVAQD